MGIGLVGALMLGSAGLNAVGALKGELAREEALQVQSRDFGVQLKTAKRNVALAKFRIEQAKEVGREEEAAILRNVKTLQGEQRAALTKGAIDIGFGTPIDILADTQFVGDFDLATIKRNTANRVFDLQIEVQNAKAQRKFAKSQQNLLSQAAADTDPGFAFASTLLTGLTGFAGNVQQQRNFSRTQTLLNQLTVPKT